MHRYYARVSDHPRLDGRTLLVLASHPLRTRLLAQLRLGGPATATTLARALDTNSGATSYHLRRLAEVGLVTEATTADGVEGAGRERWWRATHDMHSWRTSDLAGESDGEDALTLLRAEHWREFTTTAERWMAEERAWPAAWRDAAGVDDYLLEVSLDQLQVLQQELRDVVERHRSAPPGPDARRVRLYLHHLPQGPTEGGEPS